MQQKFSKNTVEWHTGEWNGMEDKQRKIRQAVDRRLCVCVRAYSCACACACLVSNKAIDVL